MPRARVQLQCNREADADVLVALATMKLLRSLLPWLLAGSVAHAQQGDRPGDVQQQPTFPVPPAPYLPPAEALKTFQVAPGFHLELVAAEPLVEDPVAMTFDPDGRLWVVEMRSFMLDVDAHGEEQPMGRVVVLEDTDGDGKMDKRSVFADGLVMPRALALVRDGVLVAEPPKLWFLRDTDGDGKADDRVEVAKDYGDRTSPEHTANGLLWGLDNWIYSANFTARFRSGPEDWRREPTAYRGQWGIAQDDFGRLFFNSNEDQLRCDYVPSAYLYRNPNLRNPVGLNVQVIKDQSVWPIRVNPGVNRGYRPGQLRPDGTLATFTAACGPVIYRGDNFPEEFRGNAFICEPAGNLVKRDLLTEKDVAITARRAYDKSEFLASTDERFRPVSLANGPDGGLYVVDMYHGVLQHRVYVTSYLRKQIQSRNLETEVHKGRIYRVLRDGSPRVPAPRLSKAPAAELVRALTHPNGWWRDTAQRLLVERHDPAAVSPLRELAATAPNSLARVHALWTLDGMDALDRPTLLAAFASSHPKVQALAIRLAEPILKTAEAAAFLPQFAALARTTTNADLQLQLAFTLGPITNAEAAAGLRALAGRAAANPYIRDAILSGLVVRELEFMEQLLAEPSWHTAAPGHADLLIGLARCVYAEHKPRRVGRVLEIAGNLTGTPDWQRRALLDGLAYTAPAPRRGAAPGPAKVIRLPAEPPGWAALNAAHDSTVDERLDKIAKVITWPGRPGFEPEPPVTPLTAAEAGRFEQGRALYAITCAQCHQPHGLGQEGLAPPLADSEWAVGPERRLIRIALHGAHGKINVNGRQYQMDMPGLGNSLNDDQIAAILTYIRRSWEHTAGAVTPAGVSQVRTQTATRQDGWTEAELLKLN